MAKKTVAFPKKIVSHYVNILRKKIKVNGVLIFGSFAWGIPTENSDVDLVVISPDFPKFPNRLRWLSRMRDQKTAAIAMDIIGYTPKEFSNIEKHSAIMAKAKKDGKWLSV